ncbi:MAG: peptidylprolyl isomerase [Candidatus Omnitrophota bacterium]
MRYRIEIGLLSCLLCLSAAYCFKKTDPGPMIARVKGFPVYMNEMEYLGRLAVVKAGLEFDSKEGQEHYKKAAPNIYQSILDIYVMKYAAQEAGVEPTAEAVEEEFDLFKKTLTGQGLYDQFLKNYQLTEEKVKETIHDNLTLKILQSEKMNSADYQPAPGMIKDYYYQNIRQFQYPARLGLSAIFIKANKDEGEGPRAIARQKAEQIRQLIGDNPAQTFAELAHLYSDDPYTIAKGGDFGFVQRDDPKFDPRFLKAAFDLEANKVSPVVETDIGYHIVWSVSREESLESAQQEIHDQLVNDYKQEYFMNWMEEQRKKLNVERLFDPETFTFIEEKK